MAFLGQPTDVRESSPLFCLKRATSDLREWRIRSSNAIQREVQAKRRLPPASSSRGQRPRWQGRLTSASARAEKGVSSAGLTTTVQPAARAAPTLRVIMALGKFHWGQRCRGRWRGHRSTVHLIPQADAPTYRGDDGGHSDRLLEHQGPLLPGGGADDVPVDAARFLRKPLQELGGVQNLPLRLLQRLPLNPGRKGPHHLASQQQDCARTSPRLRAGGSPIANPAGRGNKQDPAATECARPRPSPALRCVPTLETEPHLLTFFLLRTSPQSGGRGARS